MHSNTWYHCREESYSDGISFLRGAMTEENAKGQKMYTVTQAAAKLDMGVDAMRRRIKDEKIRAVKDGKSYWISEEEIERYKRAERM